MLRNAKPARRFPVMTEQRRVLRFNLAERTAHWILAVTFLLLFLTGAALVFRGLGGLLGQSGLRFTSRMHHLMGYVFTFGPAVVLLFGTPRTTREWLRSIFTWTKDDLAFLAGFPKEFFGLKPKLPKQGKFNAGEKVNSLLTLFGSALMVGTGWIMLYRDSFPKSVLAWAYPLHDAGALLLGSVILGHIYLALLHPGSRESINGMLHGTVSERFAREHHARWYEEISKSA